MKLPRRNFLHLAAGAAALPAVSRAARAQVYPTRPITIVVGAAAGGPTDTIGRIISERMRAFLGLMANAMTEVFAERCSRGHTTTDCTAVATYRRPLAVRRPRRASSADMLRNDMR